MELLLLLPILWSIRNLLNNYRNVFKSLRVQLNVFEIGVSWVLPSALQFKFNCLFTALEDIYLICMMALASWGGKYDVGRWVLRLWYVEYDNSDIPLKLWKSSRSDNLTSVKWNRHYTQLVEGPPTNQGRSLREKWSWFIVKVVERNSWACSPCY